MDHVSTILMEIQPFWPTDVVVKTNGQNGENASLTCVLRWTPFGSVRLFISTVVAKRDRKMRRNPTLRYGVYIPGRADSQLSVSERTSTFVLASGSSACCAATR